MHEKTLVILTGNEDKGTKKPTIIFFCYINIIDKAKFKYKESANGRFSTDLPSQAKLNRNTTATDIASVTSVRRTL